MGTSCLITQLQKSRSLTINFLGKTGAGGGADGTLLPLWWEWKDWGPLGEIWQYQGTLHFCSSSKSGSHLHLKKKVMNEASPCIGGLFAWFCICFCFMGQNIMYPSSSLVFSPHSSQKGCTGCWGKALTSSLPQLCMLCAVIPTLHKASPRVQ